MDRSMMSMIYFVALIALFLILVIATIAVIASRSRRRDEDLEEDDREGEEGDIFQDAEDMVGDDIYVDNLDMEQGTDGYADTEEPYESEQADDANYADDMDYDDDTAYADDASYGDDTDSDEDAEMIDSAFADVPGADALVANAPTQEIDTDAVKEERRSHTAEELPTLQTESEPETAEEYMEETSAAPDRQETDADMAMDDADEPISAEEETDRPEEPGMSEAQPEEGTVTDTEEIPSGGDMGKKTADTQRDADTETSEQPSGKTRKKHIRKSKKDRTQAAQPASVSVPAEDLTDSAFAPDIPETGLTNEAIAASVREAEAMGAAIMGDLKAAKVPVETMFGINEQLSAYGTKKNKREKSKVSSDEDFYWYNREDVADRPARRPAEVYYHYFNLPAECIDDLLVEMYDGALVRTEEIRYIAYGIEPRTLTMKEIMSGAAEKDMEKKKEPTTQDLVRIYEKWCGYVDQLLDRVVEIHADEYTIQEIRKQLCEYGRSDVDTLLEGK